ncbi:MAG: isochorismatase family protein, partial [bacterium]
GEEMADIDSQKFPAFERHPQLLDPKRSALIVIDIQSVLLQFIWEKEKLVRNTGYMLEISEIHNLPTILTEHNPAGLGPTDPALIEILKKHHAGYNPIHKDIFSCCGHAEFRDALEATGRNQIIITGMETHICINQTVLDLIHMGYEVHVVEDAVRARWKKSHKTAIKKMRVAGAIICDWEMAAYELTYGAKTSKFKKLLALMKKAKSDCETADEKD